MSTQTFLVIFLSIPTIFVALDLLDRHLTRQSRYNGQIPRWETLIFLAAILALYGVLQFGGLALVPPLDHLAVDIRLYLSQLLKRPLTAQPMTGWQLLIISLLTFYLSGLWDYLIHRFFSHSRWFWFTHEYHHLPSQVFVAMPGLAVRPFAVVTTFPSALATVLSAYGLLLLAGLPLWDLTPLKTLVLLHALLLTASHSSFLRRWWGVHHLMKWLGLTTPQEHVLHHTVDLHGNYGNFVIVWDRLFGSYLDPTLEKHQGHAYGLAYDQDFLGAITMGKLKIPTQLRQRFQVERYCNIVLSGEEK